MNEKIAHLNPYKFEDNDKFSPYKCCDVSINIQPCHEDNCCYEKNREQDDLISQINDALNDVSSAITKSNLKIFANTNSISGLTNNVLHNIEDIETIKLKNDEQDEKIRILSASSKSCCSATSEDLRDDFYTKDETNEKFATINFINSGFSGINETIAEHDRRLDSLEADKADKINVQNSISGLTDNISTLSSKTAENTSSIQNLENNKLNNSDFNSYSAVVNTTLQNLDNRISANTNDLITLSSNTVDKSAFSDAVSSITSSITNVYDIASANSNSISAISGNVAAISAHVHTIDDTIGDGVFSSTTDGNISHKFTELSSKANAIEEKANEISGNVNSLSSKTDNEISTRTAETSKLNSDISKLSGDVISYKAYVGDVSNDKVDKTDLNALSATVINLKGTVSTKANQSDLEASNERISANESDINDLKFNKQDKGNYVSATILDNYYTKEQTSAATAIQEALNGKQDAGNYVSTTTLNDYYKKSETIDKDTYNTFTAKTNTELDKRADKEAFTQLTEKVSNLTTEADTTKTDLNNFKDEVSATYETKTNVNKGIDDVKNSIKENTTNISKISDLTNLKKYNIETGEFDDSGNGVLDVLHKEFHNLIKDYSETDLVGLIKSLENRIKTLEDKLK